MNANRHSNNRHSLTNDQPLYPNSHLHSQGSVAVYYPKKDFFKMIFGLLALGWMSFLAISEIWSILLGDVTREMFFSSKIFGILFVGLLSALPIGGLLYVMYGIVAKPLLAKVPILVLTPDGMYHRNSFQSEQEFIAWSEMDTIWVRYQNGYSKHRRRHIHITLKPHPKVRASVVWVDFLSADAEERDLYRNVVKYWRQYRGSSWQRNPKIPETGWEHRGI